MDKRSGLFHQYIERVHGTPPPQPASASDERDAFNRWATANGKFHTSGYNPHEDLWEAWQAGAALASAPGIDAAEPIREPLSKYQRMHAVSLYCSLPHCMDSADTVIRNIAAAAYMNGFHSGMHCAAPPAAQPSADDNNFPFYELRFIMRVLSHEGSAPKEDWQTAYGMARDIFARWAKDRAGEPWCDTMDRPKSKCGCPDCGPSLIDLGPGLRNTPGKP